MRRSMKKRTIKRRRKSTFKRRGRSFRRTPIPKPDGMYNEKISLTIDWLNSGTA